MAESSVLDAPVEVPVARGTTWRAGAMLLCVIGLPLAALRGGWQELQRTVPDLVKGIGRLQWGESFALAKESASLSQGASRSDQLGAGMASPRGLSGGRGTRSDALRDDVAEFRRIAQLQASHDLNSQASRQSATSESPVIGQTHIGSRDREGREAATRDREWLPFVSTAWHDAKPGAASDSPPLQNAVIRSQPTPRVAAADFEEVLDRLRDLGAVHYMLETWGKDAQRFRFHCKMALSDRSDYIRHFEAVDSDAMQAMRRVLAEVESWRRGR